MLFYKNINLIQDDLKEKIQTLFYLFRDWILMLFLVIFIRVYVNLYTFYVHFIYTYVHFYI